MLVTWLVATALVAADVARCESGHRFDDGAAVLEVARTRARLWRRPLLSVLLQPWQHRHGCPTRPRTWHWRHLELGARAVTGQLQAPAFTRVALHYVGDYDVPDQCERWRAVPVGRVVHTYCAPVR